MRASNQATDFTQFCTTGITPRPANVTGCKLRGGQPAIYAVLCASRDSEAACTAALYADTCSWEAPPDATPSECRAEMERVCAYEYKYKHAYKCAYECAYDEFE